MNIDRIPLPMGWPLEERADRVAPRCACGSRTPSAHGAPYSASIEYSQGTDDPPITADDDCSEPCVATSWIEDVATISPCRIESHDGTFTIGNRLVSWKERHTSFSNREGCLGCSRAELAEEIPGTRTFGECTASPFGSMRFRAYQWVGPSHHSFGGPGILD